MGSTLPNRTRLKFDLPQCPRKVRTRMVNAALHMASSTAEASATFVQTGPADDTHMALEQ